MRSSKYGVNFSFFSDQVWNWMVPLSSPEVSMGPAPSEAAPPPVQAGESARSDGGTTAL